VSICIQTIESKLFILRFGALKKGIFFQKIPLGGGEELSIEHLVALLILIQQIQLQQNHLETKH
jgi:hypothetical protein